MDVTPLVPEGKQLIQGYADDHFMVTRVVHEGPILITAERTISWSLAGWPPAHPTSLAETVSEGLTGGALAPVLDLDETFDILLVGTGSRQIFVPPAVRQAVRARGPVVDVMDTGAACRTYNLLVAEGRQVVAALLPVSAGLANAGGAS